MYVHNKSHKRVKKFSINNFGSFEFSSHAKTLEQHINIHNEHMKIYQVTISILSRTMFNFMGKKILTYLGM
jgi:hypothetical protein